MWVKTTAPTGSLAYSTNNGDHYKPPSISFGGMIDHCPKQDLISIQMFHFHSRLRWMALLPLRWILTTPTFIVQFNNIQYHKKSDCHSILLPPRWILTL